MCRHAVLLQAQVGAAIRDGQQGRRPVAEAANPIGQEGLRQEIKSGWPISSPIVRARLGIEHSVKFILRGRLMECLAVVQIKQLYAAL